MHTYIEKAQIIDSHTQKLFVCGTIKHLCAELSSTPTSDPDRTQMSFKVKVYKVPQSCGEMVAASMIKH